MSTKLLKFFLCFLVILSLTLQISASGTKNNNSKQKESKSNSPMSSKVVELIPSDKNIELPTKDGNSIFLPRVDKIIKDQPISTLNSKSLAAADKSAFSSKRLNEKLIEQKEIHELSKELGIHISDTKYLDLYREVAFWIGTPYRYGAMSSKAVDCSGFTSLIYKAVYGKTLPRASMTMSHKYSEKKKDELEPGDLVFFATRGRKRINHVGIYLGDGQFIHASRAKGVAVDSLDDSYYKRSWIKSVTVAD